MPPSNPIKREEKAKAGVGVPKTPLVTEEVEGSMTCVTVLDGRIVINRYVYNEMETYARSKTNRIPKDKEYLNFQT